VPGLIRGVARTAAIAGTATAVSNRVSRRQQGRWAAQEQAAAPPPPAAPAYPPEPTYAAPPPPPTPEPAPVDMDDKIAQLKDLAALKDAGVLTPAEFEQQKARILGS